MKTVTTKARDAQKTVKMKCPDCGAALEREVPAGWTEAIFQCLVCFSDLFKWVEQK